MSKQNVGLLQELKTDRMVSGVVPKLSVILRELEEQDKKDLLTALDDNSISAAAISRALKKRGFTISASSINLYRRGEIVRDIA